MKWHLLQIFILTFLLLSCKNKLDTPSSKMALQAHVEQLKPDVEALVKNWDGYWALERNIAMIENTNPLNAIEFMDKLANNCNAMIMQMPQELKRPEIKEQIKRVDTRINEFYSEVNRSEIRERVVENHIETIINAFDTLNKKLNRVL
ncbi:hypothetical protein DSM03_101473 [Leeuwenhoekiella aestuarii]|uniref:hypothetical protein n=1 Tax=Leeuwenhoekiella aestuarii TaxID=2249426 RepID=UPI000FFE3611|nr:hypothetical protein [Leeuwenhoekiella aestuarii]RXG19104.1 hypothetical protein DSM03_101473 [Leeuwenhoekiella aestuarii]